MNIKLEYLWTYQEAVSRSFWRQYKRTLKLDFIAGDFPRAWALLLEFIESGALCRNAEVSLAALKSFQEILQLNKDSNKSDDWKLIFGEFISILATLNFSRFPIV